ncbi:hypothetical protein GXP67_00745 [Rhodocytophaga rosea]|uniref:Uncharacterized protein n=1 Tax=Rhodocytophaga rosea TaxID=2704465 RepID=A0A6C0GBU8_9BACT|nr:hypothetical protein [Rhodocytophaga rosea]QHT65303.1 hypothetical protein GXP67_00745 [Rhodocytophaga rosea]
MELISEIIGRDLAAVERILGPADRKEIYCTPQVEQSLKAYFNGGNIWIVFIENVADWIMFTNPQTTLVEEFIKVLGLNLNKPSYIKHQLKVKYYNIHGLKEIDFIKDEDDSITHLYIKAFTI